MAVSRLWKDKDLAEGPGSSEEKEGETQTGTFPCPQAYQAPHRLQANWVLSLRGRSACRRHAAITEELCDLGLLSLLLSESHSLQNGFFLFCFLGGVFGCKDSMRANERMHVT